VLKVSVATLKRWTQSGLLPSERTEGGHRRFRTEDVQALAEPMERPDEPVARGADLLLGARAPLAVQAWIQEARGSLGSWWAVAQPLRGVVAELYRRRAAGALGAVPLEAGLDRLRCALLRFAETQVADPGDRTALLCSVPGDPFLVAPAVLQLCLPEIGWRGEWAGHPQVGDLLEELQRRPVQAVVVCCSVGAEFQSADRFALGLEALAVPVAVVGMGRWPSAASTVTRLDSVTSVRGWLEGLRQGATAAVAPPPQDLAAATAVRWDPALAVGHAVVDAQHETLFAQAGLFLQAVERGEVRDGGRELLGFIGDYARVHLRFEEELMRSTGFAGLAEHLLEHEQFATHLGALSREVEAAPSPEALRQLGRFLTIWLRDHVSGSDQRIGEHLAALRSRRDEGAGPV